MKMQLLIATSVLFVMSVDQAETVPFQDAQIATPMRPNGFADCSGVVIHDAIDDYRLDNRKGFRCDAAFTTHEEILKICDVGDRCRVRGFIAGHGDYFWIKVISVKKLK